MDAEEAIANLGRLLFAIEATQEVSRELLGLVRAQRERLEELGEDIAGLGLRVSELERQARNEHSLAVVRSDRFRTLDELAAALRAEMSEAYAELTERIDGVHEPALRALTERTERTKPA